jgi:DNA repair ATPase RecN
VAYKITLPFYLDGMRYGIEFFRGEGYTKCEKTAELMRSKRFPVEEVDEVPVTPLNARRIQTDATAVAELAEIKAKLDDALNTISELKNKGVYAEAVARAEDAEARANSSEERVKQLLKEIEQLKQAQTDATASEEKKGKKSANFGG